MTEILRPKQIILRRCLHRCPLTNAVNLEAVEKLIRLYKGSIFDLIEELKKNGEALVMMENSKVKKMQYRADYTSFIVSKIEIFPSSSNLLAHFSFILFVEYCSPPYNSSVTLNEHIIDENTTF